jgi:hypothetical protein
VSRRRITVAEGIGVTGEMFDIALLYYDGSSSR